MHIGTNGPQGKCRRRSTVGVRRSKVKVTRPKIDLEAWDSHHSQPPLRPSSISNSIYLCCMWKPIDMSTVLHSLLSCLMRVFRLAAWHKLSTNSEMGNILVQLSCLSL